jgi:heat shock protein HspQ
MNHEFKFNLGDVVTDTITGFSGVVVSRSQWISNCNTYGVQCTILKDGLPTNSQAFDEPVLKLEKEKVHGAHQDTGGPIRQIPTPNR